ncbi:MAG TPA: hypothetical protein VIW29_19590 [Polyangiaceae bacterium]
MDIAARIISVDEGFALATWNRTVIQMWRGPPAVENIAKMVAACEELLETGRDHTTLVSIVERGSPAPGEAARRALAAWSRDVVARMTAAVIVAEGSGFRSALVRGVGVALTALAPHRVPFRFCSDVDEAMALLSPTIPSAFGGVTALKGAIEQVRAAMPRTP